MRPALLTSVFAAMPVVISAQELKPGAEIPLQSPSYQLVRFDEDYSCLTKPANRSDGFDLAKYIPLREDDPLWYVSLGGELRERFEGNYDPNFGIHGLGPDSYLLQRVTLLTDVHLGERVRFF